MSRKYRIQRDQAQAEVGALGMVDVWLNKGGQLVYIVKCTTCPGRTAAMKWTTHSEPDVHGQGSSKRIALDQWEQHLKRCHPPDPKADPETRLPPHLR